MILTNIHKKPVLKNVEGLEVIPNSLTLCFTAAKYMYVMVNVAYMALMMIFIVLNLVFQVTMIILLGHK